MVFREMDPADVRKALEGHTDVIQPALRAHQEYFKSLSCYRCDGEVLAVVNTRELFRPNAILPNFLAKCRACGCEFEPYTKIEVAGPDKPRPI
jgi:hypothetical protein